MINHPQALADIHIQYRCIGVYMYISVLEHYTKEIFNIDIGVHMDILEHHTIEISNIDI